MDKSYNLPEDLKIRARILRWLLRYTEAASAPESEAIAKAQAEEIERAQKANGELESGMPSRILFRHVKGLKWE